MLNLAPDHLTKTLRQLRETLDLAEDLADRVTPPAALKTAPKPSTS